MQQSGAAEVARLALRLGLTAFGGPAAHIAMLRHEVVARRRWMSDEEFLDLLGATNLIPGPNSTEMIIHCGLRRAGWRGFALGGILFILPAALIALGLAWAYVKWGRLPAAEWILYGIKPVIIAIVVQAMWVLGKVAIKNAWLAIVGVVALALYLIGVHELAILFAAGALVAATGLAARRNTAAVVALPHLFLIFLKIGGVLYGSGYVLLAFLRNDFVWRLRWLTDQQLLDAIAVGQFTPGPVFTTATFVGYLLAGVPGAIIATVGIFLPSFIFVALTNKLVPLLRRSPTFSALLDGINAAALGLMGGVTWQLGRTAIVDWLTALLAAAAAVVLLRWKINSVWLVLGGAIVAVVARWWT